MMDPLKFRAPLIALAVLASGFFPIASAADGPTPFPDAKDESAWPGKGPIRTFGWMADHRNSFWTQREKAEGSVVFVGDSLTAGWKPATLAAEFPGMKIANRGIGGDVSRGLLFRFKEDVLDLKPKAIVLCIGTNDLSAHADPAIIESNIAEMIKQAREYKSSVPIVLCTIPPRDVKDAPTKEGAQLDLNTRLLKIEKPSKNFEVLDLYAALVNKDGKQFEEDFAPDKIHFAEPGYKKWAAALRPVLERLDVK